MSTREDAEVDLVDAEALGDHARELVGRQDAALDEHLAGAPSVGARLRDRGLDRLPVAYPRSTTMSPMKREERPRLVGSVRPGRR